MRNGPLALLIVFGVAAGAAAAAAQDSARGDLFYFRNTATATVDQVTLNFFPKQGGVLGDPRKQGKQFIRVAVTIANSGKAEFSVNYTNFYLQTSDGTRHSFTSSINKGNSSDRLENTKLQVDASTTGALYYEVGAKESLTTLTLVFTGHQGTDDKDTLIPLANASTAVPAKAGGAQAVPASASCDLKRAQ